MLVPGELAIVIFIAPFQGVSMGKLGHTEKSTPVLIEVLELVASGLVKKEIANNLGIGETTVISHVKNIYEKLEAVNAPAAVAKAYRVGLLPRGRRKK